MLVNSYPQEYVANCRSRVAEQVSAYQALLAAARNRSSDGSQLDAAIAAFEPHFFNSMVLALDSQFVHRARALERTDGNPLNEVRLLCDSIMNNAGTMCADQAIDIDPAKSVLKYDVGDAIKLNVADFILLSSCFFAEIEEKYS